MLLSGMNASADGGGVIHTKGAFLHNVQERDSILIADHVVYGFDLQDVEAGTSIEFPAARDTLMEGVEIVRGWQMDTVKTVKGRKGAPDRLNLRGGITITSFDEGEYYLPPLALRRVSPDGIIDTLVFDSQTLDVRTMPVDTATFKVHDIKAQMRYPVTFKEVLPWLACGLLVLGLLALAVWLIIRYRRDHDAQDQKREPAHIVALRKLDRYRGSKMWAPEKQKAFYSGITDTLREYIDARYNIGAMEMTTAEIVKDLKKTDVAEELQTGLKDLFERADYVKFAKYIASDEDNAAALPLAVRFVTTTYQVDIEEAGSRSFAAAQDDRMNAQDDRMNAQDDRMDAQDDRMDGPDDKNGGE